MLRVYRSSLPVSSTGRVATIGAFDGLHRGHRQLMQRLVEVKRERGLLATVISFYPHPDLVLKKSTSVQHLTSLRQRLAVLREWGVDELVLLRFDAQLAALSARDFFEIFLHSRLGVRDVVLGPDTRFGRGREADALWLCGAISAAGGHGEILPALEDENGAIVSSAAIREALSVPDLGKVARLLGRRYSVDGRVSGGDKRGRQLGFPTANVETRKFGESACMPRPGVYAALARLHGRSNYRAVLNIGVRPTFGGSRQVLEAHLPDYDGAEFYGARIEISFVERLRDEQSFASIDELKRQIGADVESARKILNTEAL